MKPQDSLRILDIGSGGGNTIFPLLDLFPNSRVIASDLSLPLLKHLRTHLEAHYSGRDCLVLQMNAEDIILEPNQFDIVVGGAILHHLFDPKLTLEQSFRVLKNGGVALFFEPFEEGHLALCDLFNEICARNAKIETELKPNGYSFLKSILMRFGSRKKILELLVDQQFIDYFKLTVDALMARCGSDKSDEMFRQMDDKWLFKRAYLAGIAESIGFSDLNVFSVDDSDHVFENQVKTCARIGLGRSIDNLPDWTISMIREVDRKYSLETQERSIIEGGIVFRK